MSTDTTIAGFTVRPASNGMAIEFVPVQTRGLVMLSRFLAVFALFWNGFVALWIIVTLADPPASRASDPQGAPPWPFVAAFGLVGLGLAVGAFGAAFAATVTIVVEPGRLTRRGRIPVLGRPWERAYGDIERLEIFHGIWDNHTASTDTLRLRERGARSPVTIRRVLHHPAAAQLKAQLTDPSTGRMNWRRFQGLSPGPPSALIGPSTGRMNWLHLPRVVAQSLQPEGGRIDIEPGVKALGELVAQKSGIPLAIIEEVIPTPSRGCGGP